MFQLWHVGKRFIIKLGDYEVIGIIEGIDLDLEELLKNECDN